MVLFYEKRLYIVRRLSHVNLWQKGTHARMHTHLNIPPHSTICLNHLLITMADMRRRRPYGQPVRPYSQNASHTANWVMPGTRTHCRTCPFCWQKRSKSFSPSFAYRPSQGFSFPLFVSSIVSGLVMIFTATERKVKLFKECHACVVGILSNWANILSGWSKKNGKILLTWNDLCYKIGTSGK